MLRILLLASSSRCVLGASSSDRRLKTELQLKTWLSCSRGRRRRRICCSFGSCALRVPCRRQRVAPIVCIPPKATKCQVDAIASPVRSSSFGFVQPRVVFCCSYFAFVFRSSHFAFCFSCFVFSLASFFSPTGFTVDSVYFFAVPANVPVLTALVSSLRHIPCYFILYSLINENI